MGRQPARPIPHTVGKIIKQVKILDVIHYGMTKKDIVYRVQYVCGHEVEMTHHTLSARKPSSTGKCRACSALEFHKKQNKRNAASQSASAEAEFCQLWQWGLSMLPASSPPPGGEWWPL